MKACIFFVIALIFSQLIFSQNKLLTYFERSGFNETPGYDSTIAYCKRLAAFSPLIHFTTFGTSSEGRAIPLLIMDKDGHTQPEDIKSTGRIVLLIQACIHAGEPDGKDAGLMFLRDIALKKEYQKLSDSVTVLFIPIFNVDGHERFGPYNRINQNGPKEMGWRTNAINLNLNRDYIKAEALETRAWLRLFNEWNPDFFIDCHTTDGADYIYPLTYGLELNGNMDENLTRWQKGEYLSIVKSEMDKAGFPIFPYVSFREWHNIESGLESWITPPMLSNGYCALLNCPSLLIETHMLKDYKTRVLSTYKIIQITTEILNKSCFRLKSMIRAANEFASGEDFRIKSFPVSFKSTSDSVIVEFTGKEYTTQTSEISNGKWFIFGTKDKKYRLPLFNIVIPVSSVKLPEFYIIPKEWRFVKDILQAHKIFYYILKNDTVIEAHGYKFSNVKLQSKSYEGKQRLQSFDTDSIRLKLKITEGYVIVPVNQGKSRLIAHIFEPAATSSLLQFGYFNSVFEQKEYGESYKLEELAREMLKDSVIKERFEKEVKNNTEYPKDSYAILNWFYLNSVYSDEKLNLYPVFKVFDKNLLQKLSLSYIKH